MCVRRTFKWERGDGPRKEQTRLRNKGTEKTPGSFDPVQTHRFLHTPAAYSLPRPSDARHSCAGEASRVPLGGCFETPHEMYIHPIDHHDDVDAIAAPAPTAAPAARPKAHPGDFGGGVCL